MSTIVIPILIVLGGTILGLLVRSLVPRPGGFGAKVGATVIFIAAFLLKDEHLPVGKLEFCICAACALLVFGAISVVLLAQERKLVNQAPHLMSWTLANFERLDVNSDGEISLADLWDAKKRTDMSPDDRIMLRRLEQAMPDMGQVSLVLPDTVLLWEVIAPLYAYGVIRRDVETYPARMIRKYGSGL